MSWLRERVQSLLHPDHDPLRSPRSPHQVFLFGLSLFSCLPLLQGHPGSPALETALPDPIVEAWGACLLVGTILGLAGIFWRREDRREQPWTGLVLERAGCMLTGAAILIYAGVVWYNAGSYVQVRFVVALDIGYAIICAWRAGQITLGMRWRRQHPRQVSR